MPRKSATRTMLGGVMLDLHPPLVVTALMSAFRQPLSRGLCRFSGPSSPDAVLDRLSSLEIRQLPQGVRSGLSAGYAVGSPTGEFSLQASCLIRAMVRPCGLTVRQSMFTSIRKYSVRRGSAEELARRVRDSFVPMIRQMPGFRPVFAVLRQTVRIWPLSQWFTMDRFGACA
jgi:hypothetical protein